MVTRNIKQCDLCDVSNFEDGMFERIGDADVCVGCINIFKRAVEHNLIILSPFLEDEDDQIPED